MNINKEKFLKQCNISMICDIKEYNNFIENLCSAMKNIGIILLAAGNSSRMGSPKQLLVYQGKTFLERITDTALEVFDRAQISQNIQTALAAAQKRSQELAQELSDSIK